MNAPVVHTLSNGFRVILQKVSDAQSFTFVLSVRAGSVFETHKERGIAHFLEHMFFKGSRRYPNPHALTKALDDIGGPYNAEQGFVLSIFIQKAVQNKCHWFLICFLKCFSTRFLMMKK